MLRRRYAAALLGLLLGLQPACKKDAPAPEGPAKEPAAAQQVGAAPAERPVLAGANALSVLPKDAIVVALADGLAPMFERLGRDRLAKEFAKRYQTITASMVAVTGRDLLDPAIHPVIGIDAKKPFGFALLNLDPATVALVLPISDEAAFTKFVEGLPKKVIGDLPREKKGAATVIRGGGDRFGIVLRDGLAIVVTGDRGATAALDTLATLEPGASLASNEALKKNIASLDRGAQGSLWVDLGRVAKVAIAEEERSMEKLTVEGDDPEWHAQRKARREAELEIMRAFLGSFESMALGGGLDGGDVRAKAVVDLADGARLGKLLRNGKGAPALVGALSEQPMLLLAGHTDPAAAWEMAGLFARADGDDLDSIAGELKQLSGVDVKAEALPLLTGEAGFAMTADMEALKTQPEDPEEHFGGTLAFGVRDPAKAKALLDKVVAVPDFAALLERDGDLWKMDIPVWRPVWFGVVGSQLAGSTDKAVLERLAKGETNGFASKPGSPLSGLLGGEGPALVYLQDITPIFWLFLARGESSYAELDAPEGASPEWLEKKKALDAAQQTARVTRKAANDREMEMVLGILEPMGALAFIVRAQEPGLVVDGGQFTKAESIPDLLVKVGSVYRSSRAAVDATHDAARMARENAWKLEDELRRPAEAQVPQVPQVAPPPIEPPTE